MPRHIRRHSKYFNFKIVYNDFEYVSAIALPKSVLLQSGSSRIFDVWLGGIIGNTATPCLVSRSATLETEHVGIFISTSTFILFIEMGIIVMKPVLCWCFRMNINPIIVENSDRKIFITNTF